MDYVVIGTGGISTTWCHAIATVPDARAVGCVSRSGRTLPALPSLPSFSSITEAARSIPFDAVIILTPNGLHTEPCLEAASLGKHVLTEKPLGITSASMDAMCAACRAAGVLLGVSFQRRTAPDNLAIRAVLGAGGLGRLHAADLSCKFWRPPSYYGSGPYRGTWGIDGGGPLMQQAIHNIDLYRWFFGMPSEVKAMMATLHHPIETEDHGTALFRHDSGMLGTLVASTLARPGFSARLEVHGERGWFRTDDDRITAWEVDGVPSPAAAADSGTGSGASTAAVADCSRHRDILVDFEEALATGQPPMVTGDDARLSTELVLRIYREAGIGV